MELPPPPTLVLPLMLILLHTRETWKNISRDSLVISIPCVSEVLFCCVPRWFWRLLSGVNIIIWLFCSSMFAWMNECMRLGFDDFFFSLSLLLEHSTEEVTQVTEMAGEKWASESENTGELWNNGSISEHAHVTMFTMIMTWTGSLRWMKIKTETFFFKRNHNQWLLTKFFLLCKYIFS